MLGLSGLGTHSHSTLPLGPTSAVTSRSERNPYSAIGGNGLRVALEGGHVYALRSLGRPRERDDGGAAHGWRV